MIGPIAGIAFAEFYLLKNNLDRERREVNGVYIPAAIAWVAGVIAGLVIKWGVGIVNVFVVSAIVYYITVKIYENK